MSSVVTYIIVIAVYFVAMLAIGVLVGRRVKSESDYFIARDQLNAPVIGFSFSATQMSGSTYLGTVGTLRTVGYPFVPGALSSAAAPWFCYILLGDRMRKIGARLSSVTLGDVFEARYGKTAGLYATIVMLICSIPTIAGQLKAAGGAFEVLLGIPYISAILLFGGIVLVYTILGGMFAVAWTDLIQGVIMMLGVFIMVPVALNACGGFTAMNESFTALNPAGASLTSGQPLMWVISGFIVWGFFQIGGQPAATTRFLTTSDDKTMKNALVYSIIFESIIFLGVSILGFASITMIPEVASTDMTLPMMIGEYLPPIIGGVILAAALGAMMSTVDSVLLMTSSLVVNDIAVKRFGKDPTAKSTLNIGRITIAVIAVLGFLIAMDPPDAILWILTTGFSVMAATFTFPLLLGLWWPGATKAGGMAGMISGTVMSIVWYVLGYVLYGSLSQWIGGIWPAVIGAIVSLIVCIVVSKATPKDDEKTLELFFNED
ncbi:MAG: sodium/proline symporter [Clostridia bacterium]|nr:sodium/proline symporter [Clostridia bacterium]